MHARTHLAFGFLIALVILWLSQPSLLMAAGIVFATLLGALFPDIDHAGSLLGRKVKVIGWLSEHRTLFHSIWFLILFSLLCYLLFPGFWLAFSLGYVSHLVLDMMTYAGIQPCYPFGRKLKGFTKSGGFLDMLLFLALIAADVVLLVVLAELQYAHALEFLREHLLGPLV